MPDVTTTKPHPRRRRQHFTPRDNMDPWERLPEESAERYEGFLIYRDLPTGNGQRRSLRLVKDRLGKSAELVERWSSEDNWLDRVAAWDRHTHQLQQAQIEQEIARVGQQQGQVLADASFALHQPILKFAERCRNMTDEQWDTMDFHKLSDTALKAMAALPKILVTERLVRGLSTSNVDVHATLDDARMKAEQMTPADRERLLLGEGVIDGTETDRAASLERVRARGERETP